VHGASKSVIYRLKLSVLEDALLNLDCALPEQRLARKDDGGDASTDQIGDRGTSTQRDELDA
jgi:hypothetical protein